MSDALGIDGLAFPGAATGATVLVATLALATAGACSRYPAAVPRSRQITAMVYVWTLFQDFETC